MEAGIAVGLGHGDEVTEAFGNAGPVRVQDAEHAVAVGHIWHDNAEGEEVCHIAEGNRFALELAPQRIGLFTAALDAAAYPRIVQDAGKVGADAPEVVLVLTLELFEAVDDGATRFRVELLEGKVVHPGGHVIEADAARQRRVDVHGFARRPLTAFQLLAEVQRLHVVHAVGQLDEQHTQVASHGQDELLEVLGLRGFLGGEVQLVELGDAVDEFGDLRAEADFDVADVDLGVFYHVMQEAGDDGDFVELHIGQKAGDLDGVGIVGFAGIAGLLAMMLLGEIIGETEKLGFDARVVGADLGDQFFAGEEMREFRRSIAGRGRFASPCASPFFRSGKGAAVH